MDSVAAWFAENSYDAAGDSSRATLDVQVLGWRQIEANRNDDEERHMIAALVEAIQDSALAVASLSSIDRFIFG
ncbi:hypothetical protein K8I85_12835, partial [bacterium]|nr:hypothetical protein [bacterium]